VPWYDSQEGVEENHGEIYGVVLMLLSLSMLRSWVSKRNNNKNLIFRSFVRCVNNIIVSAGLIHFSWALRFALFGRFTPIQFLLSISPRTMSSSSSSDQQDSLFSWNVAISSMQLAWMMILRQYCLNSGLYSWHDLFDGDSVSFVRYLWFGVLLEPLVVMPFPAAHLIWMLWIVYDSH
jgi:hypothetical protein